MEIARCEKAEGCLQQPAMMMTIVAYHAQIVPPRIGIMFMRQRKWLMPKSGYGYQERRTKKHPRYGEQQKKCEEIDSQFVMKLERKFEDTTQHALTFWLASALSLQQLWEEGEYHSSEAKDDEDDTQKVDKILCPSSEEFSTVEHPEGAKGEAPKWSIGWCFQMYALEMRIRCRSEKEF